MVSVGISELQSSLCKVDEHTNVSKELSRDSRWQRLSGIGETRLDVNIDSDHWGWWSDFL